MKRRRWPFALVALVVAATCVRLGVWQIDRLGQRRARNAAIQAARERPPIDLVTDPIPPPDSVWQRRVRARGRFDYDHEILWPGRTFQEVPGVDLITPLRLGDASGRVVLVDRGWVPSPDARHVDRRPFRESAGDSVVVIGLAFTSPRGRGDIDPQSADSALPYPVLPLLVQQLPPPDVVQPAAGAYLRRWPAPELDDGPHLSYAIQWFSFATIILVGTGVLLRTESQAQHSRE